MFSMAKAKKKTRLKKAIPKEITTQKKTTTIPSQPIDELRALANNSTDSVNQLRRQLRNVENDKSASENTSEITKRLHKQDQITQIHFGSSSQDNDSEHERKIIEAARSGMSPQEISKKYHISTDQVSLILKVAGIKLKKG
jgi:DNA-binding NarL/FixJ family response regulator